MRGEYRIILVNVAYVVGSPPHARGIRRAQAGKLGYDRITPACAGNTNKRYFIRPCCQDHPRMRGEYRGSRRCISAVQGSPPHARGILDAVTKVATWGGITPACAGNTLQNCLPRFLRRDHPRMRGEYFSNTLESWEAEGSPPHARGIH